MQTNSSCKYPRKKYSSASIDSLGPAAESPPSYFVAAAKFGLGIIGKRVSQRGGGDLDGSRASSS